MNNHTNLIEKIDYYTSEAILKGYVPEDYSEWTLRAFEFASLGEDGRDPFHRISSTSSKYDFNVCNDKFSECVKNHNGQRNQVSFFRHCTDFLSITPFSKVHRTDVPIKAANTSSTQEGTVMKWRDFVISKEPPEEIPLNKIGEAPIATSGNHSLVIGKKKSRKSLFLVLWLTLYLRINPKSDLSEILIFDTEQGTRHVWKVMDRIYRMTGFKVTILYLRGKSHTERKEIIEEAIKETKPKVVFIDGIRDLISNINDPDQATELITWLERITLTHGVHIVNVLHQNKTDNNARGHIGSELLNKCEITIELERDEKADCTLVKCESSRDIPFEPFAFRHDESGLPQIVGIPTSGKVLPELERKNRLAFVFEDGGGQLTYAQLAEGIKINFEVGLNKAKTLLAEFNRAGWIVKNDSTRKSEILYKVMV